MRYGPKRGMMTEVPREDYTRVGYGLIQVPDRDWRARIPAIRVVKNVISSGRMPENMELVTDAFSVVKGTFSRIYVGDCYDWYSTSRLLAHPSNETSLNLACRLGETRKAILTQDADMFHRAIDGFEKDHGFDFLYNYEGMAVHAVHPIEELGWAYILWSSSERDALHIGAASGTIEDVCQRLNVENPSNHPYGVLAAWLVHDPVDAYNDIGRKLSRFALGDNFYRINLGLARRAIHEELKLSENFAKSPWHEDEAKLVKVEAHEASAMRF